MAGEESSINFKRKILQKIKYLTNHGRHVEAQQLYTKYFEGGNNGKS